jgi:hypothetical protein
MHVTVLQKAQRFDIQLPLASYSSNSHRPPYHCLILDPVQEGQYVKDPFLRLALAICSIRLVICDETYRLWICAALSSAQPVIHSKMMYKMGNRKGLSGKLLRKPTVGNMEIVSYGWQNEEDLYWREVSVRLLSGFL